MAVRRRLWTLPYRQSVKCDGQNQEKIDGNFLQHTQLAFTCLAIVAAAQTSEQVQFVFLSTWPYGRRPRLACLANSSLSYLYRCPINSTTVFFIYATFRLNRPPCIGITIFFAPILEPLHKRQSAHCTVPCFDTYGHRISFPDSGESGRSIAR